MTQSINLILNVEVWGVDSDSVSVSKQIPEVAAGWSRSEGGGLGYGAWGGSEDDGRWGGHWDSLDDGNWTRSGHTDTSNNTSATGGLLSRTASGGTTSGNNGADSLGDEGSDLGDNLVDNVIGGGET